MQERRQHMDEERRNAVRDIAEALARLNIQNAEIIGNQRMPGPSERRGGGFSPVTGESRSISV